MLPILKLAVGKVAVICRNLTTAKAYHKELAKTTVIVNGWALYIIGGVDHGRRYGCSPEWSAADDDISNIRVANWDYLLRITK